MAVVYILTLCIASVSRIYSLGVFIYFKYSSKNYNCICVRSYNIFLNKNLILVLTVQFIVGIQQG